MSVNDFVTNPLNIILVKNGSKGDRLLFRYPFAETKKETVVKNTRQNPFAMTVSDDTVLQRSVPSSNISNGHLVGFPDKDLSNLFAVKTQLCGKKFELKVNDVRFVGHPILLQSSNNYRVHSKGQTSTIILFNIVFALSANASHAIVQSYHDLSCRLGKALSHEEKRCGYLSKEDESMLSAHDEVSALPDGHKETAFELILQRSQLARELKQVYDDICSTGYVHLRMNYWLQVSFCLLQRVHQLHGRNHLMNQESLKTCLEALRPYHAMLLLVNEKELLASLPLDASTALMRLIQVASPLKSLKQLSADADLSLSQVFQLVGHLVYWAKATIIYPLCETNVYVLSPQAPTHISSHLVEKFSEKFPGESLLAVMSEFSLPVSLSQRENLINLPHQQKQLLQMMIWMLQHNLLMQLHTYVYLTPTPQGGSLLTEEKQNDTNPNSPDNVRVLYTPSDSDLGSVASEEYATTPILNHTDGTIQPNETLNQKRILDNIFPDLSPAERDSILRVPAANNLEDLLLFKRLYKYFCGNHHLEEIMYLENIRRTQLLALLDKFREVLVTCQHEDDVAAVFYTHSKT